MKESEEAEYKRSKMAVANATMIAIVVPAIAREGISKLVISQIKGLQNKEYEVVIVALSSINEQVLEEMNVHVPSDRLLVLKQQDSYLSVRNLFNSFLLLSSISKFLKYHNVRVVIAHAPYAHFVMRLVKLISKFNRFDVKLIQYFHITQYAQFPLNTVRRLAINKLNKILGKNNDDVHLFVSKVVKDDVELNLFNHPSSCVIYNALPGLHVFAGSRVAFNNFAEILHVRTSTFLIVVPGRIEPAKGQLFFVEVFNLFLKQLSLSPDDVQLLVVGEGYQRKELESKIEAFSLEAFTSLPGVVPNALLLQLMRQADLVVLPSFFEGLPLVALEAIQTRSLLLTSDIGSFQEIIEHGRNGFMFRAGDVTDCFAKLQFIYANRDANLIDLDEVAQQVEHKFSFERHMTQLIQAIKLVEAD